MINIQNVNDNEWFKWCLVKYLHAHNPRRIRKVDKDSTKKLDFADVQFSVKTKDIQKIEKESTCTGITVFGYENKQNIQPICQKILSKTMLIYYW